MTDIVTGIPARPSPASQELRDPRNERPGACLGPLFAAQAREGRATHVRFQSDRKCSRHNLGSSPILVPDQ